MSSNVNEVVKTILSSFIFFYKKISYSQNSTKRLQANKNKKGSVFMHLENISGEKVTYSLVCAFVLLLGCVFVLFGLFVLFVRVKSFCKKEQKDLKLP